MQQILNILSNTPPNWVQWITFFLATSITILRLIEYWTKRQRFEFETLIAEQYYVPFTPEQIEKWDYYMISPKVGGPRETFTVLEFTLTNKYPQMVTIGRINVGGWMYSNSYTGGPYDHARDYRVFDLHTGEPASIDGYNPLPPGDSIALRVEAYEHQGSTHGYEAQMNRFASIRSRRLVDLPKYYRVKIHTNVGNRNFKIKVKKRHKLDYSSYFRSVYRLSGTELLCEKSFNAVPQGVKNEWQEKAQWIRFQTYVNNLKYKIQKWANAIRRRTP